MSTVANLLVLNAVPAQRLPLVQAGELVVCPDCRADHPLRPHPSHPSESGNLIVWCGERRLLAAVDGHLVLFLSDAATERPV